MSGILDFFKIEAKYIIDGGTAAKESELQKWVEQLATHCGWRWYHNADSRRAPSGLPDLILMKPPLLLFIELKKLGRRHTLKEEQAAWLADLTQCGVRAEVWTPAEIPKIWQTLTGLPFSSPPQSGGA